MAASAKQPFGKGIGVEYLTDLYETALPNASRFLGTRVEFYGTDAAQFSMPHEPCVLYFFNPFDTPVLNCVLGRIASRPVFSDVAVGFERKVDEQNIPALQVAGCSTAN